MHYLKITKLKIKNLVRWFLSTWPRRVLAALLVVIFIIAPLAFILKPQKAAAWWDDNWYYRKSVEITNNTTVESNVYITLTIDTSDTTRFQTDCGDLRFTKSNGELLPYYVDSGCGTASTSVLVGVDTLAAGQQTLYYYYGNPTVTNGFTLASGSGSVTRANMRLSVVNGTAFADFSAADKLTQFLNRRLVIADSATKKLTGYIKAAGTGETLSGSEVATNGDMETGNPPTGWNPYAAYVTLSGEADDAGGGSQCLQVLRNAPGGTIAARRAYSVTSGGLYKTVGSIKNVDATNGNIVMYSGTYVALNLSNSVTATSWTPITPMYVVASDSTLQPYLRTTCTADGQSARFDNLSIQQVLTPSATGVTITSTSGGGTYNWASEEVGFNRNDASNYSYVVYAQPFTTAASNYTVGAFGTEEKSTAPVGYWSFDEGYGSTAHDETSNRIDGTFSDPPAVPTWKPESECASGKCLSFDGNDSIGTNVSNESKFDFTDNFSICSWAKWQTLGDNRAIVYKANAFKLDTDASNQLRFTTLGVADYNTTFVPSLNSWYHVCSVMDSSDDVSFYVNGKLFTTVPGSNPAATSNNNLMIGYGTSNFKGYLDEIKIYPYARTASQIKKDYNAGLAGMGKAKEGASIAAGDVSDKWLTDGLVGHWKMDEVSSTTVADASGNSNTGALASAQETGTGEAAGSATVMADDDNATLSTTDDAYNGMILYITGGAGCGMSAGAERIITDYDYEATPTRRITVVAAFSAETDNCTFEIRHQAVGKFGSGVGFDKTDDYVNLTSSSYNFSNSFSVSLWFQKNIQDDGSGHPYIIDHGYNNGASDYKGWTIAGGYWGDHKIRSYIADSNKQRVLLQGPTLSLNRWYHAVLVKDGSQNKAFLYVDGKQEASANVSGYYETAEGRIRIGTYAYSLGNPQLFLGGLTDDVRIYNRALSPDEIQKLYNWAPGPIGHWGMDENVSGSSKTIYDDSGNAYNGTTGYGANATGMNCTVAGKYGGGCQFDGVDDYVTMSYPLGNTQIRSKTVEAWININAISAGTSYSEDSPIGAARIGGAGDNQGYFIDLNPSGNTLRVGVADYTKNYITVAKASMSLKTWYHVSLVHDFANSKLYLYLNGTYAGESAITGYTPNPGTAYHFAIANYSGLNRTAFNGLVDDVRVYNYARTPGQIVSDMNAGHPLGGSPVGSQLLKWKFDEGYSSTAYDSGPQRKNGVVTSASWTNEGKFNKALNFDNGVAGSTVYFNDTAGSIFDLRNDFSFGAWAYRTNTPSTQARIVNKGDVYNLFTLTNNIPVCYMAGLTPTSLTATSALPLNTWTHVMCTYKDNIRKLYVNGRLDAQDAPTGTITSNDIDFVVGNYDVPSDYYRFRGIIDEVEVYGSALTADEVETDYNRGASLQLGSSGSVSGTGAPTNAASGDYCVPGDITSCAGPKLELKFDEKSGTTAYDTSGNGYNGSFVNTPTWGQGKFGSSVGVSASNYISVADNADLRPGTGNFTAQFWIKIPFSYTDVVGNDWPNIVLKGLTTAYPAHTWGFIGLASLTDNIAFQQSSDAGGTLDVSMGTGTLSNGWHFITARRSGTTTQLYADGKFISEDTSAGSDLSSSASLYVGGNSANSSYLIGNIDMVRYYNYARTPAQIAYEYNKGKPVAEYRFNECQGGTIHDESGNNNNGTIALGASGQTVNGTCTENANTPWWNGASGKYGASMNFDGSDDRVSAGVTGFSYTRGSVSAWVNPSSTPASDQFIVMASPNANRIYLYRVATSGNFGLRLGSSSAVDTGTPIPASTWSHLLLTWDSGTYYAYLNGNQIATGAYAGLSAIGACSSIGSYDDCSSTRNNFAVGKIDEVKIFNYALTATQVKQLYNNSSAVQFGG